MFKRCPVEMIGLQEALRYRSSQLFAKQLHRALILGSFHMPLDLFGDVLSWGLGMLFGEALGALGSSELLGCIWV